MAKSILTDEKVCWFCLSPKDTHCHHIYFGGNRKISDKHGFTVYLCARHHNMSNDSVHHNRAMDLHLKKACQVEFEQTHSREDFIKLIGRSYL